MSIICAAWKTDIMPAHAYAYFHAECWEPYRVKTNLSIKDTWKVQDGTLTGDTPTKCWHCGEPLTSPAQPKERAS